MIKFLNKKITNLPMARSNDEDLLDNILSDIPNLDFRQKFKDVTNTKKDVVFNGEPQIGKTKIIIYDIWKSKFIDKLKVLIFAWERKDVLDQLKSRIEKFDMDIHKKYPLRTISPFEIESHSKVEDCLRAYHDGKSVFITILSKARMDIVHALINTGQTELADHEWRVIIDEGDMSIKKTEAFCEQLQAASLRNQNLHFHYFGATNFAIFNSEKRMERDPLVVRLPEDLYEKYQYRSYKDYIINIEEILDSPDLEEEETKESIVDLLDVLNKDQIASQPNIGLLNIVRENKPKYELAAFIAANYPEFYIIVYTGNGYQTYHKKKVANVEGKCVGKVLSELQSHKTNIEVILFIATNMAGRAQTFKSQDNTWILTHMFLSLSESSSIETIVQSLRGNGQYLKSQPKLRFYASSATHDRIQFALDNNEKIMKEISAGNIQEKLSRIRFIVRDKPIPFSNRELGGNKLKGIKTGSRREYDIEYDTEELFLDEIDDLLKYNSCDSYVVATDQYDFNIDDLFEETGYISIPDELPFIGLTKEQETIIKKMIADFLKIKNIKEIKLCTTKDRMRHYNRLHQKKPLRYRSKVVALSYNDPEEGHIVSYKDSFFESELESYNNKIIVWHTTENKIRVLIMKDKPIIFSSLRKS